MEAEADSLLRTLARKYFWWKNAEDAALNPRRVIAQVLNIGDFDDVRALLSLCGVPAARDAVAHAEPGWFSPRSWSYWHYRLELVPIGHSIPALPKRRMGQSDSRA